MSTEVIGSSSSFHPRKPTGRIFGLLSAVLIFCITSSSSQAIGENTVGNAQRELKRQQFYNGAITNELDQPTKDAIRRFQIRRALKVTGELDPTTLATLATAEPAAERTASVTDDTPARERAQSTVQDDTTILRELETEGTLPPAKAASTSRSTHVPPPGAENIHQSRPRSIAQSAQEERPEPPVSGRPGSVSSNREPELSNSRSLRRANDENATISTGSDISADRIYDTVDRFVSTWNGAEPDRELSFYADKVSYYGQGTLSRESIARDQRNYYKRWPKREFKLIGNPQIIRLGERDATVRYRYEYQLRNGRKSANGRAEHFVRFEQKGEDLKVASVRERKID